jgi:hypothetical protein
VGRLRSWISRFRRKKPQPDLFPADPPDEEPALVPRRPRPSPNAGSVALELPDEPEDVDARGREAS